VNCYIIHLNGPVGCAYDSVFDLFSTRIIDNSLSLEHPAALRPPLELPLTGVYNLIQKLEFESHYCIMHDDAVVHDKEVIRKWIDKTLASKERWYQSSTHHQALAMYPKKAIADIGPWDQTFFNYYMDYDYDVRARHLGYINLFDEEAHKAVSHIQSSTQKRDPLRMLQMQEHTHPFAKKYFEAKWGSLEKPFDFPFNGRLL